MQQRFFLFLFTVFFLTAGGCMQPSTSSIGVVDPVVVFQSCKSCLKGMEYLQDKGAGMEKALAAMQEDLSQAKDQEAAGAQFQQSLMQLQQEMQAEQQRIAQKLKEAFDNTLEQYRMEKGLALIVGKDHILASSEEIDITQDIIAALDKQDIDLEITYPPNTEAEDGDETKSQDSEEATQ